MGRIEESKIYSHEGKEQCGVFGIYNVPESARLAFFGLYALQHRGQESAGIATVDASGEMYIYRGMGLVSQVFDRDEIIDNLPGSRAVGHVRYSTNEASILAHCQPYKGRQSLLSYNGNQQSIDRFRSYLHFRNVDTSGFNDTSYIGASIDYNINRGATEIDAVREIFPLIDGSTSVVFMTSRRMIAFRDYHGVKPLSLGQMGDGFVVASETCAFDIIGAHFLRDIDPGEAIIIDDNGIHNEQLATPDPKMDAMEYLYISRPDSMINGQLIYQTRLRLGEELAEEAPVYADLAIGIPDSGNPSAEGYAKKLNIPYREGLIKNRYVGRTFINPTQSMRDRGVRLKMNPMRFILEGNRVVMTDDTIIRGTTTPKVTEIVRKAGAKEVHMRVTSPPYIDEHGLGIDTPNRRDLIANNMSVEQMMKEWKLDSLHYLSLERMVEAIGVPANQLYLRPFTGQRLEYAQTPIRGLALSLS